MLWWLRGLVGPRAVGIPRGISQSVAQKSGLHASAISQSAPRPSKPRTKLKSHSGAKKRFFPVLGSAKGNAVAMKFTRNSANKQHLNSGMSRVRLHRLNGTKVISKGPVSRMLRRLLSPSY